MRDIHIQDLYRVQRNKFHLKSDKIHTNSDTYTNIYIDAYIMGATFIVLERSDHIFAR